MPIGILIDVISVAVGGVLGSVIGQKLPNEQKQKLEMIFGVCSMGMGVVSIILMVNMPAVIFALVIGTAIGVWLHLEQKTNLIANKMQSLISHIFKGDTTSDNAEFYHALSTILVIFCTSGTGIYGSIISGISGEHTILISKAILDFFTAMIFACNLGSVVTLIAIPQFLVFISLFLCASWIYPLTTPEMILDFKACGGFLMLATGFRIIKVKEFPTPEMIPAMILVMPFSWLFSTCILPLLP